MFDINHRNVGNFVNVTVLVTMGYAVHRLHFIDGVDAGDASNKLQFRYGERENFRVWFEPR